MKTICLLAITLLLIGPLTGCGEQGLLPEELVREFSQLTLAQVYDTLSYYYDQTDAIEQELTQSSRSG